MFLLLLSCRPVEITYMEGATFFFEDSAPVTTDSHEDADSNPTHDSDSGPRESLPQHVDSDGDGAYSDEDCNDTNPSIYPGADESTHDEIDNDCDGSTDEDWNPCAEPYEGWMAINPTTATANQSSYSDLILSGYGWICSASCDVWWLEVVGISSTANMDALEPLPFELDGNADLFLEIKNPGEDTEGTCTLTTSFGDLLTEVLFR